MHPDSILTDFYMQNHRWLQAWVVKKVGSTSEAADLAHDVFANILSKPSCLQLIHELREPKAYLATVAKGVLVNHFKRQTLEQAYLEALADHAEWVTVSAEEKLILLEVLHQIDQVLDGLSAQVRQAFLFAQLEGLSYADIARKLGISERTVKRHMAKAYEHCLQVMVM